MSGNPLKPCCVALVLAAAVATVQCCTWLSEPQSICLTQAVWTAPEAGGKSPAITVENCGRGDYFHWELRTDCDWLFLSRTSGNTPGSFTVTAAPNVTGETREATITVFAKGVEGSPATIRVEQGSRLFAEPVVYAIGGPNNMVRTAGLESGIIDNLIVSDRMIYILRYDWKYGILAEPDVYSVGGLLLRPAAADVNGDGYRDLIVGTVWRSFGTVYVLLNSRSGSFPDVTSYDLRCLSKPGSGVYVAAADFDGDGDIDIAASLFSCSYVSILKNTGNGAFEAAVGFASGPGAMELVASDFNGDGAPDLAIACSNADNVAILMNNGRGSFTWPAGYRVGDSPCSIAAADVDGDGHADLLVADSGANTVSFLRNRGDGTFEPRVAMEVGTHPVSVAAADFNQDGYADVAAASRDDGTISVLLRKRDGTFELEGTYKAAIPATSVATADLDRDGDPDLAAATAGYIYIFKNLFW